MDKRTSMHYIYYGKESRRSRLRRIVSYIFLGLLAAATAVVVHQALTR